MITAEEFFRNKIKEEIEWEGNITLHKVPLNAEQAMRWAFEYAEIYAKDFKLKSEKWDELDEKIGKFYENESDDDDEENEDFDDEGNLGDIGEISAIAFGYL